MCLRCWPSLVCACKSLLDGWSQELVEKEGYPMDEISRERKVGRGVGAKVDDGKAVAGGS
jgi:hypothetical protein